ncbi:MAG: amidase [Alphaproteobacteria bacterium]|nr:amidase [Alphaproteobacteria bacterium]MCW5743688.1 amidase [Alphaproteobacteria bacterium]
MTEPCDLSAVELRRMIGRRKLSPVELLDSCFKRIGEVNPKLNAFVAMCEDRARAEARAAERAVMAGDRIGPLHGLPVGIKDLQETEGLRTVFGSPLMADNIPNKDERTVAAIRHAGAIVVGKTNTPEFGAGANTTNPVYGPTRNPFDPARICGGSSGGSAVALATSMVPICSGSDTGGSLRIPAAFCGVVGFRPSPGVVPSERRPLGWTPLSVLGPMGRDVADTALLMSAMAAYDPRDPLSKPVDAASFASLKPVDLSSLRVAFSIDLGFAIVDDRISDAFKHRARKLAPIFRTAQWRDPDMGRANDVFEALRATNFLTAHLKRYEQHRDKLGPNIVANVEQGLKMTLADAAAAHAEQTRVFRAFQDFFRDVDVLITPTVAVPPFPVEQLTIKEINGEPLRTYFHWLAMTYAITNTGHPAISIPSGLDPTGTPLGLQIVGPHHGDQFVLEVAQALEAHLADDASIARPVPNLATLSA